MLATGSLKAYLGVLVAVAACRALPESGPNAGASSASPPAPASSQAVPAPAASAAARELEPLRGKWLELLGAEESGAVVTPPLGARSPRRLVIGVHGAGDRPEWSCGGWRLAARAGLFVLCPRGTPAYTQSYAWTSSRAIERALDDALLELRRRYGPYLDEHAAIYAGFSQGATLAEPILRARAAQFPIAILAEGGYATSQNRDFARAYRAAGGRRIVLVCGTPGCFSNAARAKPHLEGAALEVLVIGDAQAGHNLNQRMQTALERAWPEIIAPPPG